MSFWQKRLLCLLYASCLLLPISLVSDESNDIRRENALQGIEKCLRSNEVSSRECKNLNKDIGTLEEIYRQGDRSVLPTLFRFTDLRDFYGDALISDPEFFLPELSRLPEKDQQAVAAGVAGVVGPINGLPKERFEAIRATLQKIPEGSPFHPGAQMCLHTLELENAWFLTNYFPPRTFRDPPLRWYSREMYAMELRPLWPPSSTTLEVFRIILLPAFTPAESVTLTKLQDGTGKVEFRTTDAASLQVIVESPGTITALQLAGFKARLNRIGYWQMPTQEPPDGSIGVDGAQWILEGVNGGEYHVVDRWCPGTSPFGNAVRELFSFAGHKKSDGC